MKFNDKKTVKPIFIVGMNGSGTTMLADCLNRHSQIFILKIESRVIPYYFINLNRYGNLESENKFEKLLSEFSNNLAFQLCNNNKKVKIQYNFNSLNAKNFAEIIDITFSHFASKENKIFWGDHSPKYCLYIPVLIKLFPNARILHIIRDGRECALSFHSRFAYNKLRSIYNWKTFINTARKDGHAAGEKRYLEVKYEDLTVSPETYMKNICSFLEVPYERQILISDMPMYKGINGKRKAIVPNSDKWREKLSEKQIKKLEKVSGLTLKELGYDIVHHPGDKNIPSLMLFALRWLDKLNTSLSFFRRYHGDDKLIRYLKYVSTSFKQDNSDKY